MTEVIVVIFTAGSFVGGLWLYVRSLFLGDDE